MCVCIYMYIYIYVCVSMYRECYTRDHLAIEVTVRIEGYHRTNLLINPQRVISNTSLSDNLIRLNGL